MTASIVRLDGPVSWEASGLAPDRILQGQPVHRVCNAFSDVSNHFFCGRRVTVSLSQLGITGPAYAWDWVRHPTVRSIHGKLDSMEYAQAAHLFRVSVHPATTAGARTAELVVQ